VTSRQGHFSPSNMKTLGWECLKTRVYKFLRPEELLLILSL
jgi:hypothetical protein